MDNHQAKIFAASLNDDLPTLDLHGLFPDQAIDKLESFLYNNFKGNQDIVLRVVYGGGTGKLGEKVLACLNSHNMVKEVVREHGCCLVVG